MSIHKGDITDEKVSAITNAANENLWHGGGIAGAISRKAGKLLDMESENWVKKYGCIPTGDCAWTGAGNMKNIQYVVHAVGPVWKNKGNEK